MQPVSRRSSRLLSYRGSLAGLSAGAESKVALHEELPSEVSRRDHS